MNTELAAYTSSKDLLHQALLNAGSKLQNNKYFCPFHDDKSTPNGAIHEHDGKWTFKCFSCGAKGDYFDILAHNENRPVEDVIRDTLRANTSPPPARARKQEDKPKKLYASIEDIVPIAERMARGTCTQRFLYTDPDTKALEVCVLRIEKFEGGKEFWQCHPVEGGFHIGMPKDTLRPLYNRARVRQAQTVVFVEGEGVVHALHDLGIVATTALGGANGRPEATDWTPLAGKTIIVWPDNDEVNPKTGKIAGQLYVQGAIAQLECLNPQPSIRTLDPRALAMGVKEDAKDYINRERAAGKTKEQVKAQLLTHFRQANRSGISADVARRVQDVIDGKHVAIPWKHQQLSRQTKALLPGTVTIVGGTPGSGKSWFVLENLIDMYDSGISIAILMLEENRTYWAHRAMAIKDADSLHFDDPWVKANPATALAAVERHAEWLDEFGKSIFVTSNLYTDMKDVIKWVAEQAARKTRVIVVDPITLAVCEGDLFREELKALSAMKSDIDAAGSSLILVTHPKQGNVPIGMNAMAGSAAYQRACQCIIWLEHLDEDTDMEVIRLKPGFGAPTREIHNVKCNRRAWLLKTRNASGHGLKIAYHFTGKTFSFEEQGLIVSSTHKNKAGA